MCSNWPSRSQTSIGRTAPFPVRYSCRFGLADRALCAVEWDLLDGYGWEDNDSAMGRSVTVATKVGYTWVLNLVLGAEEELADGRF